MIREYENLEDYLNALQGDHNLAIVSITDVAKHAGVGRAAIEQRLARGTLTGVRIDRSLYVTAESIIHTVNTRERMIAAIVPLIETAARSKETITYGDLMSEVGMNSTLSNDRGMMGRYLGMISHRTQENAGIPLSVLVVNKASGLPVKGFFECAENLGYEWDDEEDFCRKQMKRVWKAYRSRE